ncbi:MAG: putative DNA-binding domain-containing protein, partial [Myxococcales bacterium]|nr:putative DNA-binding domain-containing protein [Myxococcales bacterium]
MPVTLAEVHRWVHAAVRREDALPQAAQALGVDPDRLAIYRRFVRGHVAGAVRVNYALTAAACAPDAFEALVTRYVDAHPATHWRLDACAEAFAPWLAEVDALTPPQRALAELEAALMAVRVDPSPWPALAPGQAALNPTLALLEFPYPLVPWALALGRGEAAPLPDPLPSLVLAFRRPVDEVVTYHAAHPDWLFALKVIHDGLSAHQAAAASGQPVP